MSASMSVRLTDAADADDGCFASDCADAAAVNSTTASSDQCHCYRLAYLTTAMCTNFNLHIGLYAMHRQNLIDFTYALCRKKRAEFGKHGQISIIFSR